jgi:hypothetical protein
MLKEDLTQELLRLRDWYTDYQNAWTETISQDEYDNIQEESAILGFMNTLLVQGGLTPRGCDLVELRLKRSQEYAESIAVDQAEKQESLKQGNYL